MARHLLLEKIHIYDRNHDKQLGTENSKYSLERGFWLDIHTSQPLVQNPRRPLPSTKKHDVERGEDLK
ncbi:MULTISPECIES: hypothetical protein [Bacillus cereus group]|uniref:hypothetical protein n=1 Tax=Bacillus cereus group TaxID=86661 RepID=UPI001F10090F|nr:MULTISPECIES: hypothetical protein [Bacillus cereus group]MCH5452429.1 hypothetical protein [Bacillus toyonensis]MDR4163176.1 hypothetical protein [Bacillus paranthracis]MDZ4471896.1 hypothetical protein [Bacillus cereus]WJE78006.1 hypothetical protein QRE62_10420 [Bacillus mycoides]HDR7414566.1 hypothetical protein [Bacillus toyonensis]